MNAFTLLAILQSLGVTGLRCAFRQKERALRSNCVAAALALVLAGCATLPDHVQHPVSQALTDVATTHLAAIAAASTPSEAGQQSGFQLLPHGDEAFESLIGLARRAEMSLDVQYYLIASDRTGLQFLGELRDAAERGVRVRVLIDDLHAVHQDGLLSDLAARPHVEVRLFNPLPVRGGSFGTRVIFSLHEFSRINRRMHNKLFIADNTFAVTGGRNIADEYFGRAKPANFVDMDALLPVPWCASCRPYSIAIGTARNRIRCRVLPAPGPASMRHA